MRHVASTLAALGYPTEGFGTPDAARTTTARREFRADAQPRGTDGTAPSDIAALWATVDRSRRTGAYAVPPPAPFPACETVPS